MPKLLLFDIDGTLLDTGGSGGANSYFHLKSNRFPIPCRRATAESDMPGASVSAMIRFLSEVLKLLRASGGALTAGI